LAVIEKLTDNAAYERLLLETIKAVAEAEPSDVSAAASASKFNACI
jgi:hypothetical protein